MLRLNPKFSGLISAVALAGVLSMGSASATTYTSTGSCEFTDIVANADACFGSIDANVSDSESLLNNNTFGTDIGLFGHTDWDFLTKQNTPGGLSGTNIGLFVDETSTGVGTWSVNSGALDIFDRVVFILKAGNTFSSYLYAPGSDAGNSGSWSWTTSALEDKNLSHFSIYTNEISPVPVPAAIWLFGTALLGFISMSRRTKV
jgi:hypothetical protein